MIQCKRCKYYNRPNRCSHINGCSNVTPYSYCSNAELKREKIELSYGVFSQLKKYHFDRDVFCNTFMKFVTDKELTKILSKHSFVTSNFIFKRVGDEFYIIHMRNGIIINWYKDLGRNNTCNISDFTEANLKCFFNMFTDEWKNEIDKLTGVFSHGKK